MPMPTLQSKLPDDPHPALRDRLVALRDDTLRQLAAADYLDAGLVALLGNVGSALAVLDRPASPAPPAAAVVIEDVVAQPADRPDTADKGCGRGGDRRRSSRTIRNLAIREYAELLCGRAVPGNEGARNYRQGRPIPARIGRREPRR
jgi:hypothetical protein